MPERFSPEPLRIQVGILLSGCGRFDGTDVQEAVLCGLALDRHGARAVPLASRRSQMHVVDHTLGDEMEAEPRDMLVEAARIFHDKVRDLDDFPLVTLQALVVPGGFGTAKNLVTGFARPDQRRAAHPAAAATVRHFLEARKPLGVVGLGDILVSQVTGQPLVDPRAGDDPSAVETDGERRILTTGGFKSFQRVGEVAVGIDAMIRELVRWVKEP